MRKLFLAFLALILILSAAGCEGVTTGGEDADAQLLSTLPLESAPPETFETEPTEASFPLPNEVKALDTEAARLFRSFLDDNYDKLMELSFKYLVGIGFIDLNLDGVREMILFDAGASASLGVEIFEVFGGKVRCVTANIEGISDEFGKTTDIIINANFLEDFRLMEDNNTAQGFFVVENKNGNVEGAYSELIRFGRGTDGALTLTSLFYRYDEYDLEAGDVILHSQFKLGGSDVSEADYMAALEFYTFTHADKGLECRGVFIWENGEYTESRKSFMETADKALELYESNRVS